MYEFHKDKDRYFDIQYRVTKDYIIPFLEEHLPGKKWNRVLEIGSAEAGVLKAFLELGANCTGIELSADRVELASRYHAEAIAEGRISFVNRNVFDIDPEHDLGGRFDLVILKDVIEHIPGQKEFMHQLASFLEKDGVIFFGFPPWYMPYGGHQQVCKSWVSKVPYVHLLPTPLYKSILQMAGESEHTVQNLLEVKSTGISIERFEKALQYNKLGIIARRHYLTNPIYQYKFGWKPRKQNAFISRMPVVRNFFTTASYYIIKPLS